MEDQATFFVRRQGQVEGPWPLGKLRAEIALRKLGRHHELSDDGTSWRRAGEVEGLFESSAARKRVGPLAGTALTKAIPEHPQEAAYELEPDETTPNDSAAVWHYSVHDQQIGPVRGDDIILGVQDGRIPLDALVWRDGLQDWVTVKGVPELMGRLDQFSLNVRVSDAAAARFSAPVLRKSRFSGYALWGGIVSLLLSWVPLVGFAGILPIVFGLLAINEVHSSNGELVGIGRGIAGVMLGLASIGIAVIELTAVGFVAWQRLFA